MSVRTWRFESSPAHPRSMIIYNSKIIMAEKEIGKVIHYFDKAMVAVIRLSGALKVGDDIKFVYNENEFTQPIESMEVEHKKVKSGKKGNEVAIKLKKETHEHAIVYKI